MSDAANGENRATADVSSLDGLMTALGGHAADDAPPVDLWNPEHCGDIGMEIRRDGSWWYQGSRIGRERLVRLFARILRKDDDGVHYLVTPVEKIVVHVELAPLLAVRVDALNEDGRPRLAFATNVGDVFVAGPDHPILVSTDPDTLAPTPLVRVRGKLDALMTRPCFFDLVELAEIRDTQRGRVLTVESDGARFELGRVEPG